MLCNSRHPLLAVSLVAAAGLSGCGGGGGATDSGSPAQPPGASVRIGGSIAGMKSGGMVLANGDDSLTLAAAASSFSMPAALAPGASYALRIASQPPRFSQRCTAANAAGTVAASASSSIRIDCADHPALVQTLAGNNNPGRLPLGPPAVFSYPSGLALDEGGNLYVADHLNRRIAKVTPAGAVSTFAGLTPGQEAGAADRMLGSVEAIARDQQGNLYTLGEHTVRKIGKDGAVTVLAGGASPGFADGSGTEARFNTPLAIAVDSAANVYVADTLNLRIRKITPAGVVTTIAGNGVRGHADGPALQASFGDPWGIAVDKAGMVYFSDRQLGMIRKLTPDGVVTTVVGRLGAPVFADGPGPEVTLKQPTGLAIDKENNLYVAEAAGKIRIVTPTGWVGTVAGSYPDAAPFIPNLDGVGETATFSEPRAVAVDAAGVLYIIDRGAARIRKVIEQ
jgi:serine/threonine-protein kinase